MISKTLSQAMVLSRFGMIVEPGLEDVRRSIEEVYTCKEIGGIGLINIKDSSNGTIVLVAIIIGLRMWDISVNVHSNVL